MRKYTLLISIAVHVVALVTIIVAPLLAAVTLPGVHASIRWVPVKVEPPPPALGDSKARRVSPPRQVAEAVVPPVPTQAPPTIEPEAPASVPNLPIGLERPGSLSPGSLDGIVGGDLTGWLTLQYFNGYGESLLYYNRKVDSQLRLGIAVAL